MIKKLLLILVIATGAVTLVPFTALSNQMGMGNPLKVNAIGISADYARTKDRNDAGLYASYRYGFANIVSIYFAADAGYRFMYNSINARAGGQLQFIVVGIEAGLLCAYRTKREHREWYDHGKCRGPWAPGMFVGLSGTVPGKRTALFISLGGNFYFINHDHEFYLMATGLVNFAGDLERKPAMK